MWQTIDSAPKDGTHILGVWCHSRTGIYAVTWFSDGSWHEWDDSIELSEPTHWMPLPEGPK